MREILGKAKTIRELLSGAKYSIDYYQKRPHYNGQNILARTLCDEAYERNPGLKQFIDRTGVALRPHADFKKANLEARQALYLDLAKRVWAPAHIQSVLEGIA